MNTWSFRPLLAAFALVTLGGCEELGGASSGPVMGLTQAKMAGGAFTLVPPDGFCIDKRSLRPRFALLARCDTLGLPDRVAGAPLAIITISLAPGGADASLPTPEQTANAAKLSRISSAKSDSAAVTFRAEGAPPLDGLDVTHWRGHALVAGQIIGVALYGPKGGRAVTLEGRDVISNLFRRSRAGS